MARLVLLLFFSLRALCLPAQESDCTLKKDKDDIQVYTCKSDSSKFRSLKAEFVIEDTSIEELKEFLFTVSNYMKWQFDVTEATMLKRINEDEMIYRVVIDAPWPVDNRELIVHFAIGLQEADRANFTINTVPSDLPIQEDLVRIPYSKASWDITRVDHSLHVTYRMNINPGGNVPAWLVNLAMADGPHESFRDLKKLIETRKD
jgi:hypothetical protein